MRKLKLQVHISLDGYVAGPNGEENWVTRGDGKLFKIINEIADTSDTLLLGRKFAQMMIPHFESVTPESPGFVFSQKMVNIPKIIFTETLEKSFGKNTSLSKGNLSDEIVKLKQQKGKDILVYGGASFVSSLIAGGHIDEFFFFVNPILINKGKRIFDILDKHQKLSFISATPGDTGVILLHYKLKNE